MSVRVTRVQLDRDSDLVAIAQLETTPFGRGLLTAASADETRAKIGFSSTLVGNDAADNRAAFAASLTSAAGKVLEIPTGIYRIVVPSGSSILFVPGNNTTIRGQGKDATVLRFVISDNNYHALIQQLVARLTLEDLTVETVYAAYDGTYKTSQVAMLQQADGQLFVRNCRFVGNVRADIDNTALDPGEPTHQAFAHQFVDDILGAEFENCEFVKTHYVGLKTNTATFDTVNVRHLNSTVTDCVCGLGLNSPSGNGDGFDIDGGTFTSNPSSSQDDAILHFSSVKNLRVRGALLQGVAGRAIHIEEAARNCRIEVVINGDFEDGIRLLDNDVSGTREQPQFVDVSGSIIRKTASTKTANIGFLAAYDSSTESASRKLKADGMVLSGWATGIQIECRWDENYSCSGNQITDCTTGLNLVWGSQTARDNEISNATTGVRVEKGGLIGRQIFRNVTTAFLAGDAGFAATGWKVILDPQSHAGGSAAESKKIIDVVGPFRGTLSASCNSSTTASDVAIYSWDVEFDGTTLRATSLAPELIPGNIRLGLLYTSNTLYLNVYKTGAAATDLHIEAAFDGIWEVPKSGSTTNGGFRQDELHLDEFFRVPDADDTNAFTRAIAVLSTRTYGGTLRLPDRRILTSSSIEISAPGIFIKGNGKSTVWTRSSDFGHSVRWRGANSSNGILQGGGISGVWMTDGNDSMTAATSPYHVIFDYVNAVRISNVEISNGAGGIALLGSHEVRMSDVLISILSGSPTGRKGIYVGATTRASAFQPHGGDHFWRSVNVRGGASAGSACLDYGIDVLTVDGLWISDSHSIHCKVATMRLNPTLDKQLSNIFASDLMLDIAEGDGLVIQGNGVLQSTQMQIELSHAAAGGTGAKGIMCTAATEGVAIECSIRGFNGSGIVWSGASTDLYLHAKHLNGLNADGSGTDVGIDLDDAARAVIVLGSVGGNGALARGVIIRKDNTDVTVTGGRIGDTAGGAAVELETDFAGKFTMTGVDCSANFLGLLDNSDAAATIRIEACPGITPLFGSATWNPPSLADGTGDYTTVTVTGAAVGDMLELSASITRSGLILHGEVSASNTVTAVLQNETGGVVDLGSLKILARVEKVF